jgi:hypothetical protein
VKRSCHDTIFFLTREANIVNAAANLAHATFWVYQLKTWGKSPFSELEGTGKIVPFDPLHQKVA